MRKGFIFALFLVLISISSYAFEGLNNGTSLDIFNRINCGPSMSCTKAADGIFNVATSGNFTTDIVGDGGDQMYGFLKNQVAATATTITAAQCGSVFLNTGASPVQMELPEASTVIGCQLSFVTATATAFTVNPDNADQILVQTNAAGDATSNATLGNSITIQAISASQWAPISVVGTWSDAN